MHLILKSEAYPEKKLKKLFIGIFLMSIADFIRFCVTQYFVVCKLLFAAHCCPYNCQPRILREMFHRFFPVFLQLFCQSNLLFVYTLEKKCIICFSSLLSSVVIKYIYFICIIYVFVLLVLYCLQRCNVLQRWDVDMWIYFFSLHYFCCLLLLLWL